MKREIDDRQVERGEGDVDGLENGLVQLQHHAGGDAEQGGRAEDREQRKGAANGNGQGNLPRRQTLGELGDNGIDDPPLPARARGQ